MAPGGGSDFLVNIRTQFTSVGLNEIAQQARQIIASTRSLLAETHTLPGNQQVGAVAEIRRQAESQAATVRQGLLAGKEPGTEEYRRASGKVTQMYRNLDAAFSSFETQTGKLPKINVAGFTKAVDDFNAASAAVQQRARGAAATAGRGLDVNAIRSAAQDQARVGGGVVLSGQQVEGAGRALEAKDRALTEAATQEAIAADREYAGVQARIASAKQQQAAAISEAIAADASYAEATGRAAVARRLSSAQSRAVELGTNLTGVSRTNVTEVEVANSLQERIQSNLHAAAVARAEANREGVVGHELAAAEAERRAAVRQLADVQHQEARAEVKNAIARGQGSTFQRLQAQFAYRGQQKQPEDYQSLGQFVGSRALTTVGFGVAGTALYGSVRIIGDMIRESNELDRILNQVNATLVSTGNTAEGGLGRAKQGILDIAAATGQQADQVAGVFQQFIGAFGDGAGGIDDVSRALDQTNKAMQIVSVTGLSLGEVLDSLTAVAKTFGSDIDAVSDSALGLQERFGVMAKETVTFVADLAPVAKEIGLSMQDLASLGAVAQQVSGQSGSTLAANFNRVLPALQDVKTQIVAFYNLPQLKNRRNYILEQFATGQTGNVFEDLIRNYHLLDSTQQKQLITTLGSRRETATLVSVFENASKAVSEFDKNAANPGRDNGKTKSYFDDLQNTVAQTKLRFTEMGKQIGEALLSAGLAEFFTNIINIGGQAVGVIAALTRVFGGFNDLMGGVPGKLLLFVGIMRLLSPIITRVSAALAGNTAAQIANSEANVIVTETETGTTVSIARHTAVTEADTVATSTNNVAKRGGLFGAFGGGSGGAFLGARGTRGLFSTTEATAATGGGGLLGGLRGPGGILAAENGVGIGSRLALGAGRLVDTLIAAAPVFAAFEAVNLFMENTSKQAAQAKAEADKAHDAVAAAEQGHGFGGESPEQAIARLRAEAARSLAAQRSTNPLVGGDKYLSGDFLSSRLGPLRGIAGAVPGEGLAARFGNFLGGGATKVLSDLPGVGRLFGNQQSGNAALRAAAGQDQVTDKYEQGIAKALAEQYSPLFSDLLQFRGKQFEAAIGKADLTAVNQVLSANKQTDAIKHVAGTSGKGNKIEASDLTAKNIEILLKDAQNGGVAAGKIISLIFDFLGGVNGSLFAGAGTDKAKVAAGGDAQYALQNLGDVQKQYQAGAIGPGTYLTAIRASRKIAIDSIKANIKAGVAIDPKDISALADDDKQLSDILRSHYDAQLAALNSYSAIIGSGSGPEGGADVKSALLGQKIAILKAQVGDKSLSIEDRGKAVDDLIKALQEKWQRDVDAIADPLKREQARKAGFQIPPELQQLLVVQQVSTDPATERFLTQLSRVTGIGLQTYFNNIAQQVVSTSKSVKDIMLSILDAEIAKLQHGISGMLGSLTVTDPQVQAQIADLQGQREAIAKSSDIIDPTKPPTAGYGDQAAPGDTRRANAEAQAALARARANGDPVGIAKANLSAARAAAGEAKTGAEKTQARAQIIEAENALADAQNDIVQSRIDALAEQVKNDPIRAAQVAIDSAHHAIATAKGQAAKIRADQQLADANKALEDAQFDLTLARIEQTEALASAAGDTVGAAQAQVGVALQKLNKVLNDPGSSEASRIRATNDLISATASARDADFEKQLNDVGFLQQMEWISTQQAIQMLTAMSKVPGYTAQQYQQLLTKIKELTDSAKQDYKFNLPDNIDVPSLYEVRRLNQTPGGSGYNDNRIVTINFTANNTADATAIANTIVDGFGAPSRFGTTPRRY